MGRACGPWVGWAASPIDVKRLTRTPASYSTHTQGHHSSHTTSDRVESILCEIRDSDVVMLYVGRIASYVERPYGYIAIGLHDPRCAGLIRRGAVSPSRRCAGLAVPDAGRRDADGACISRAAAPTGQVARVVHRNGLHLVTGERPYLDTRTHPRGQRTQRTRPQPSGARATPTPRGACTMRHHVAAAATRAPTIRPPPPHMCGEGPVNCDLSSPSNWKPMNFIATTSSVTV